MARYYNVEATPQNFRALWDRIHDLADQRAADQATIASQAATIADLQDQLSTVQDLANQAAITAGKATSATTQSNSGGGSTPAGSDSHPNYYQVVVDAKAELVALGEDLSGPCGAFKITRKVAQNLVASEPTSGLLDKPTGNNCTGYAVDIICFNDGIIYDILIDAGGANDPDWRFGGTVDPARWRPSFQMITKRILPIAEWYKLQSQGIEPFATHGLPDQFHTIILVVEDGETIAGVTTLTDTVHWDFYTAPAFRGHAGVFRGLLEQGLAEAQFFGIKGVHTTISHDLPEVKAMAERFGFLPAPGQLYLLPIPPKTED